MLSIEELRADIRKDDLENLADTLLCLTQEAERLAKVANYLRSVDAAELASTILFAIADYQEKRRP